MLTESVDWREKVLSFLKNILDSVKISSTEYVDKRLNKYLPYLLRDSTGFWNEDQQILNGFQKLSSYHTVLQYQINFSNHKSLKLTWIFKEFHWNCTAIEPL